MVCFQWFWVFIRIYILNVCSIFNRIIWILRFSFRDFVGGLVEGCIWKGEVVERKG